MKRKRWLRYLGYLAVLVLLISAFSPIRTRGREGAAREAASCRTKLSRLWIAAHQGGSAHASFTESELNAYLARVLKDNPQVREARGLTVGIRDVRVDTTDGQARLFVTGALSRLPFVLEYRLGEAPKPSAVRCRSIWLGRLPLVPPLKWIAMRHLQHLMGGLQMENKILEHLSALTVQEGLIRVEVTFDAGRFREEI